MRTDRQQLELIRKSILDPEAEEKAKELLLRELYEEVRSSYRGVSASGAKLAELPECVKRGRLCEEDMGLTYNGIRVLYARYLSRDEYGRIVETPSMVMRRVALGFMGRVDHERLLGLLLSRRFLFNSPTLFNMYADGAHGSLSACYVTPIYDDMKAIMNATIVQAMTFKYGGGQGFSFSNLRPRWALIKGTGSYSSGPISFITIYDRVTEAVKQGGKRRGANMGILHDWHPDIYNPYFDPVKAFTSLLPMPAKVILSKLVEELKQEGYRISEKLEKLTEQGWLTPEDAGFIQAKRWPLGDSFLTNFNISVGIHDAFMEAVVEDEDWWMVNPQLSETTTGDGDYKIHYSVSRATGLGILSEYIDKIRTPFFSILEDEIEKAKKKGLEILKNLGITPDQKNPYVWKYPARKILKEIIKGAWETGDPGLVFLDNHNKFNPTPWLGMVVATNPCVSADTLILTRNGWKTAKEVYEEGKRSGILKAVLADEKTLGKGGEREAYPVKLVSINDKHPIHETKHGNKLELLVGAETEAWVWYVGKKNGVRVKTKEGYEITVTKEHKFLTPSGWKEAINLKPGEKIMISRLTPDTYKNIEGIKLDEDIAFLLGWIVGDGTLNDYYAGLYFNKKENEAIKRVLAGLEKLGAEEPESHVIERENEIMLFIKGRTYRKIISLLGEKLEKQPERRIPRKAWMFDFNTLRAFLRGLFTADGTVDNDKAIRLTSASISLLKDVQILLTGLGIYSKIYERPYRRKFVYITRDGEKKEYESTGYYELVISGYSRKLFMELIGFEEKSKNTKAMPKKTKIDPVWATIKEIEEVKDVEFYDFTVPRLHNYIANGIVNHNCGEQPLYPFESCNLGSVSVEKYVENGRFKLEEFVKDIETIVDAMDAVIDLNRHPDERQVKANRFTRKIGLGIMGLADLLAKLGYPYDSEEAVATTMIIMAGIEVFAWKRSWELGARLGHAPAFECRVFDWRHMKCMEKADPEELLRMHTPALVKASRVSTIRNDWLVVKYHDVPVPPEIIRGLVGEAARRVNEDGSVKLVRWSVVENVLESVFGITPRTYIEAVNMAPEYVVESPKHLLALAVYAPILAWDALVKYGRKLGAKAPRNTVTTTVAPTGSISIIAGTSSGIEPYFALVFERRVTVGNFLEVVRLFRDKILEILDKHGLDRSMAEKIFETISRHKGSIRWALPDLIRELPRELWDDLKQLARLFATSMDFDPWYHLAHNAAAQLYVDQAISKTVNLAKDVSEDYVETVYFTAWLLGLKGVTVYRDESKTTQVIVFGATKDKGGEKLFWRPAQTRHGAHARRMYRLEALDGKVSMGIDENSTCRTCHI